MITMTGEQFQLMMHALTPVGNKAVCTSPDQLTILLQVRAGILTAVAVSNHMAVRWKTAVKGGDADMCIPLVKPVKCSQITLETDEAGQVTVRFDNGYAQTFPPQFDRVTWDTAVGLFDRQAPVTHSVIFSRKTLEQVLKVYKDKDALRFELHGSVNPVNVTPLHGDALAAREVIFTPVRPT